MLLKCGAALGPVHELGHILFSTVNGIDAWFLDWNHCQMEKYVAANVYGGYRFDIWFWGALGILGVWKRQMWIGGFGYGAASTAFIKAYFSTDFNSLAARAGLNVTEGLWLWTLTSGVVIVGLWVFYRRAR